LVEYFNQNLYQQKERQGIAVGQNPQQIYSLTGNYLDSEQFKHNNMIPFNGGKVKGRSYDINIAETVLDNMMGSGSQITSGDTFIWTNSIKPLCGSCERLKTER